MNTSLDSVDRPLQGEVSGARAWRARSTRAAIEAGHAWLWTEAQVDPATYTAGFAFTELKRNISFVEIR